MKKKTSKKTKKLSLPVQLREESYGPFTGRTQNFMRYSVGQAATDARIKRSS